MSDQISDLKNLWQASRNNDDSNIADTGHIIKMAKQKMKSNIQLQVRTILILIIALAGIAAFFKYVAPFKQTLSHIAVVLMLGSLGLRIIIELVSIYLSANINLSQTALKSNHASLTYFRFRKIISSKVSIIILVIYSIAFYMLTPEFSLYLDLGVLILIDLSYLLAFAIFMWLIRNTAKKEMKILNEMLRIQHDITGESETKNK
ncbi:MAG: hypothetical protein ABI172_06695 [Ginsengibacter sp.]